MYSPKRGHHPTMPDTRSTKTGNVNSTTPATTENAPEPPLRRGPPSGGSDLAGISDMQAMVTLLGNNITSSLEIAFTTYKQDILKKLDSIETKLIDIESRYKSRIFTLETDFSKLNSHFDMLKSDNDKLKEQISTLELKLNMSERYAVENEQYSRKNSARFFGLPLPIGKEDSKTVICDFVNDKLQVQPPLLPADIDIAHRVGKPTARRTQAIICKFVRRTDKHRVIKARTKLKGSGFGISDDVAKAHIDFMDELKQRPDVSDCWFFDGKIFMKPKGTENICNPRLHCNLPALIKETLERPARRR